MEEVAAVPTLFNLPYYSLSIIVFLFKVWKQLFDSDHSRDKKEATSDTDGTGIMSSLVSMKRNSSNLNLEHNF